MHTAERDRRQREDGENNAGPKQDRRETMAHADGPPAPSPDPIDVACESIPEQDKVDHESGDDRRDCPDDNELASFIHTRLTSKPRAVSVPSVA